MFIRLIIVLFITLFALGSALWLDRLIDSRISKKHFSHSESVPDYYMKEFTVQGTTINGQPKFKLSAKLMNHYPYDDHSDLIKPKLIFYAKEGPPWHVQSETGRISSGGTQILLFGLVHITRDRYLQVEPISIITRNIVYRPATNYVSTKESVNYTSGDNQIYGVGMESNFADKRIVFHSNTKGHYELQDQQKKPREKIKTQRDLDRNKPMNIKADKVYIDEKSGVSIYEGNVIVVQGTMRITANKLTVTSTQKQKLNKLVATGSPATYKQKRAKQNNRYINAIAKKIIYYAKKDEIVLHNKATLKEGGNTVKGNRIRYNIGRDFYNIEKAKSSTVAGNRGEDGKQNSRVRIILETPKDDKKPKDKKDSR